MLVCTYCNMACHSDCVLPNPPAITDDWYGEHVSYLPHYTYDPHATCMPSSYPWHLWLSASGLIMYLYSMSGYPAYAHPSNADNGISHGQSHHVLTHVI